MQQSQPRLTARSLRARYSVVRQRQVVDDRKVAHGPLHAVGVRLESLTDLAERFARRRAPLHAARAPARWLEPDGEGVDECVDRSDAAGA